MLHTTFVDVCMHVHVSCHPASHQLLMRPAGSLLGPNQTGDGTDLALSAFYTPPPRSLTPTLHCPPDILGNHGRLSMWDRFGNGQSVCVESSASTLSRCQGPESKSPKSLQLQTCLVPLAPPETLFSASYIGSGEAQVWYRTVKRRKYPEAQSWEYCNWIWKQKHGQCYVQYCISWLSAITFKKDKIHPIQHVLMGKKKSNAMDLILTLMSIMSQLISLKILLSWR